MTHAGRPGTAAALFAALAAAAAAAHADVHTVSNASDDPVNPPPDSLRHVLTKVAKAGDTIRFSPSIVITMKSSEIVVPRTLAGIRIVGPAQVSSIGATDLGTFRLQASGVVVEGMQFRNVRLEVGTDAADVGEDVSDVTVMNCSFSIRGGVELISARSCRVEQCTFALDARRKTDAAALRVRAGGASRLVRNTFDVLAGRAPAIDVGGTEGVTLDRNSGKTGDVSVVASSATVTGNEFESGRIAAGANEMEQTGPFVVSGNTCGSLIVEAVDATVSDNVVGGAAPGAKADAPPKTVLAVSSYRVNSSPHTGPLVVSGNRARGGSFATISCIAEEGVDALTVSGNTVTEPARQGLLVSTRVPATVSGNSVSHDGGKGKGVGIALSGRSGAEIACDGNTVTAVRGTGFEVRKETTASFSGDRAENCSRHGVAVLPGAVADWSGGTSESNGGDGLYFSKKSRGSVTGATVRGNGGAGVAADAGSNVRVSRTSFSANRGPGIDLAPSGVTPNGARKKANGGLGWPTELEFSETSRAIEGKTLPGALVEVFRVEDGARQGNPGNGEGATFVAEAVADDDGRFVSQFACSEGDLFTVTVTVGGPTPVTSEFSEDVECVPGPSVELLSVSDAGAVGNDSSTTTSGVGVPSCIGGGGRWVVFTSQASNLVPGDTNTMEDVFLRDTQDRTTVRITRTHHGGEFNPGYPGVNGVAGTHPSISEDGRFVVYATPSPEVISGDEDRRLTVVLHDRQDGSTVAVTDPRIQSPRLPNGSDTHLGGRSPEISADGGVVAFVSDDPNWPGGEGNGDDVFVWTRATGEIECVSLTTGGGTVGSVQLASLPRPSGDGRFVAFGSWKALVPGNSTNGQMIFLRDRQDGTTVLVSADESGAARRGREPAISGDGRYVAFISQDPLVADDDAGEDVYVFDRTTGTRRRVVLTGDASSAGPGTQTPTLSADGRFLALAAPGSYQVPGGPTIVGVTDILLADLVAGTVVEASVGPAGEALGGSGGPCLSRDGRALAFVTSARNLVPETTVVEDHVYLRRLPAPE